MTILVKQAANYEAVFADMSTIGQNAPKLEGMSVTVPADRWIVQENGVRGFDSNTLNYTVYFTNDETKSMTLKIASLDKTKEYTISGSAIDVQNKDFYEHTVSNVSDGMEIPVTVSAGGISTTYTVTTEVLAENESPQVVIELNSKTGAAAKTADLGVVVKNANFTTLSFKLSLDGVFTLTDKSGVASANAGGTEIPVLNGADLANNPDNYFSLYEGVQLKSMKVGSDGKYLEVTLAAPDNKAIITNEEGAVLIKFYLLKSTDGLGANGDKEILLNQVNITSSVGAEALVGDIRFIKLNNTVSPMLYVKKIADAFRMAGVVQADADPGRVMYTVRDLGKDETLQIMERDKKLTADYLMESEGPKGTYQFDVTAKGYLPMQKIAANISKNYYFDAMMLIAGELYEDGAIDVNDRAKLLQALDQKVTTDAQGNYVTVNEEKIYGDFNDEGQIDAIDLAIQLSNYGRTSK